MKGTPKSELCVCVYYCVHTHYLHTHTHIHTYIGNIGTYECIYPYTFTPSQFYSEAVKYVCRYAESRVMTLVNCWTDGGILCSVVGGWVDGVTGDANGGWVGGWSDRRFSVSPSDPILPACLYSDS